MPRRARKMSKSGIYHIMLRGINRQDIFEDDEDRERLLETIKHYQTISGYSIYGYCLMSNHLHWLVREREESLSLALKRICGSYVYWYNRKYERCGHLFQERYKNENVEDDQYFLTVLRYIHQNPLKAGMVSALTDYPWSSYPEYSTGKATITDIGFGLDLFSKDRDKAIEGFEGFMQEQNEDRCLEYQEKKQLSDSEVRELFSKLGISNISELQHRRKAQRDEMIRTVKDMEGVTVRQLSRITGVSKSVIDRA